MIKIILSIVKRKKNVTKKEQENESQNHIGLVSFNLM